MYPAPFEYYAPASMSEALALMAQHADAKLMAGGHSLLPAMKLRLATPTASSTSRTTSSSAPTAASTSPTAMMRRG